MAIVIYNSMIQNDSGIIRADRDNNAEYRKILAAVKEGELVRRRFQFSKR